MSIILPHDVALVQI